MDETNEAIPFEQLLDEHRRLRSVLGQVLRNMNGPGSNGFLASEVAGRRVLQAIPERCSPRGEPA